MVDKCILCIQPYDYYLIYSGKRIFDLYNKDLSKIKTIYFYMLKDKQSFNSIPKKNIGLENHYGKVGLKVEVKDWVTVDKFFDGSIGFFPKKNYYNQQKEGDEKIIHKLMGIPLAKIRKMLQKTQEERLMGIYYQNISILSPLFITDFVKPNGSSVSKPSLGIIFVQ